MWRKTDGKEESEGTSFSNGGVNLIFLTKQHTGRPGEGSKAFQYSGKGRRWTVEVEGG